MSSLGCWRTEQELTDEQTKNDWNKLTGRQDAGPYSCTTTNISSGNNSDTKTRIEYDIDETLDIKEEIIPDQERHQWEKQNLLSERNQLDEKCITNESSSANNSGVKTSIEYDYVETLEIKEESVQDHGNMDQRLNKKYESKLHTLDTKEADIMTVKEPRTSKTKKLQEPKSEPKNKHNCEKCGRSYAQKQSLRTHKKFKCDVMPQFRCELCGKHFKIKRNMDGHILRLHHKTDRNASQTRHNCDICSQSYSYASSLRRHKCLKHPAVRRQFICDYCGFQAKQKGDLSQHITSRHFQQVYLSVREKKYKCEKCGRNYFRETYLNCHKKFECDVIPQFSCKFCGRLFKLKGNMNRHMLCVHKKTRSMAS